eukprot:SAG22_NODE_2215_length_2825_cov_20.860465_1_plen_101_part_10
MATCFWAAPRPNSTRIDSPATKFKFKFSMHATIRVARLLLIMYSYMYRYIYRYVHAFPAARVELGASARQHCGSAAAAPGGALRAPGCADWDEKRRCTASD